MSNELNEEIFLRPRFEISFTETREELLMKFKKRIKEKDYQFIIKVIDYHIIVDIPRDENHFWSPQLHMEIVDDVLNNGSILKVLFGPKPQVWTMFMFLHFIIGTLFIGALVMFYSGWSLNGNTDFPIISMIVLIVIWMAMYFGGRYGRSLGKDQMTILYDFMSETLVK